MRATIPLSLALCTTTTLARRLFVQPTELSIANLDDLSLENTFAPPAKIIQIDDIIPVADANGNNRCCPVGTVNNGVSCVYPESSVCPVGTRLVGSLCVSEAGPQCPTRQHWTGGSVSAIYHQNVQEALN